MRASSLDGLDVALDREVQSKYDDIKSVADKIQEVETVANADLNQLSIDVQEILDFTGITVSTVPNGNPASWDSVNKVLYIPEGDRGYTGAKGDKGDQGVAGVDGATGPQGIGVDHIKATNTTEPHGDFSVAGYTDTYSLYGDVDETILLGYFSVTNGASGLVEFTDVEKAKLYNISITQPVDLDSVETHTTLTNNPHNVTKSQVGLGNVDNTSDVNKPISDATQSALDLKLNANHDIEVTLVGDVTGSATITNMGNVSVSTTLQDDSHNHTIANIDSLQQALDSKLNLTGGTVTGTLVLEGDIIQNGAAYETHAEQVYTTKDEVILRDGAIGALGAGVYAGIRAKLYDGVNDGLLVFGNDGIARVGDEGSTQALATREDNPTDTGIAVWNDSTDRFETTRNIDVDSIAVSGVVDGRDISSDGAKLDGIENGATADQTASEIKIAYESNSDTNAYTDVEKDKVGYIKVTQTVDLDSIESDTNTNNAKVSNVTTNISTSHNANSVVVNSSDGTDGTINAATTSLAGVMTGSDKTKLNGIEANAKGDQLASEVPSTPNGNLIGTNVQSALEELQSKIDLINEVKEW